ncbi:MAG: type I DNA topoisomerase [Gammaproteobacteria bacterium]|jgi:DNA topoisomerase-1|nr:type I DNA topoisomerase [Gammaproteobacteria bacterium]
MGKSLVIVESPAKAKTINKYLGNDFIVKSSVGHIRDLPTKATASSSDPKARAAEAAKVRKMAPADKEIYKAARARRQLVRRMGIDPENDWKADYQILPGKEKVVDELKRLAKNADAIYLATDLDREGEAIAWHLREAIGGDENRYQRVVFNEITKSAIQQAFAAPGQLNMDQVDAQQARRFLDRVVGFMVSPLLWAKIARGLSAGRVQSVAVKLVVERERDIRAFIPEEYWEVKADLHTDKQQAFVAQVFKHQGGDFRPNNQAQTETALAQLQSQNFVVQRRTDKATSSRPSAPYITSTLQQAASTRLNFGVKKTMMMAQRLYEAGYITYMRTDSTNLSQDAVAGCRDYITDQFGEQYLPKTANSYASKEGAQEAHEAIRPSDVRVKSTQLAGMERDAERLYELIWRQFVACQMMPAQFTSTGITIAAGDFSLRTRGRIMRFDGYTKVQPSASNKEDDLLLPDLQEGDQVNLQQLHPSQHFTKPAPRYSEASLVKELEKKGIGRPSTYAAIISTIQDRGYVSVQNRRFYAEKMGDIVTDRLEESFAALMDYDFTANMEKRLDSVAGGDTEWKRLLNVFYKAFTRKLSAAETSEGMRANDPTMTDIACPACARPMTIRTASTGVFLGCSGYALPPKERCKETINLTSGDEVIAVDADDEAESRLLIQKHRCKICDTAMESYLIDSQRKLHVCGNNPDCAGFEVEQGTFRIKGYDGPKLECDKCGQDMHLKNGRFGKYFDCSSSDCKNTRKLLRGGQPAPPKMDPIPMPELACEKVDDHYILRDGAAGLFLAASKFPKNRETRAPLIAELLSVKDCLDPKYSFLLSAPPQDPDGNPSIVRYSRKTKEQYVMTEVDKKASGWQARFDNGRWVETAKAGKAKSKRS